jgi:hypothetical protein
MRAAESGRSSERGGRATASQGPKGASLSDRARPTQRRIAGRGTRGGRE